jgi:Tfp pilus assembly protein PilO
MKKIIILMIMALVVTLTFGVTTIAYAEELPSENNTVEIEQETEQEPIEETTEIEETESVIKRVVEWIIAGLVGLFGTSCAALFFRACLKGLINEVKGLIANIKANKELSEEELIKVIKSAKSLLASLEGLKGEMSKEVKERFDRLEKVLSSIANGTKELVVNGVSETVDNLLKEANASEKV